MENPKRIEAEFQLPEAIIQHIQSFLHGNEAAQTTILSRSWYNAWLTRPNLDFDQKHFVNKSDDFWKFTIKTVESENRFWEFVIKTVERYEKLNLTIDSLKLWIRAEHSLVNELIIKALKMGATSLDFKIYYTTTEFALPHQVFGFENLTGLTVRGCKIGAENGILISCSRLKSLTLDRVYPQGNIIWDIISSCPFIENFLLNSWEFFEFGKQNVVDDGPILVNEFRNLKRLYLRGVVIHYLFFDDFSSKFPILNDLVIYECEGCTDIEISSPSLECIDFTSCYGATITRVGFDVPGIRKFTFSGTGIPPSLQQACLDSCIAYQSMSEGDLKKVKIEFYDRPDSERPFRSLDATSTSLEAVDDEQGIQFYLKWEEEV